MKKYVGLFLLVGLVVGSLIGPAEAAKKKKKKPAAPVPVAANFYIRDQVAGCDDDPILSTEDGPDEYACSFVTNGIPNEALARAGQDPDAYRIVATSGVPFVLDATKDITTDFTIRPYQPNAQGQRAPFYVGGGQATLDITVAGTVAGAAKEIAKGSATFTNHTVTPMANIKIALKPDPTLDKMEVSSLDITVVIRGAAIMTGWFVLDDPASLLTVPTLQVK